MVVGHHPISTAKARYSFADSDDSSSHLMAKDAGRRMRAGMDLLQIRSADAAGGNLDENFAGADGGDRHSFDPHVVDAAIHYGPHGGRNLCLDVACSVCRLGSHLVS
jgi:hypothetical protein